MSFIPTEYFARQVAANVRYHHDTPAVNGILDLAECGLVIPGIVFNEGTTLAELADFIPEYDGYDTIGCSFGPATRDELGKIGVDSDLLTFQMTNADTPTTIGGYYVTDAGGTNLLGGENFTENIGLEDALSFCAFVIRLLMTNPDPGGATVVQ